MKKDGEESLSLPEDEKPPENLKNIVEGNILDDSFFDKSLEDISDLDDLKNFDFSTMGEETSAEEIQDVLDSGIEISPDKIKTNSRLASTKEKKMSKSPEGPDAIQSLWDDMEAKDGSDYKLMLYRLEPQTHKGLKIAGYLETYYLPISIPDIIEKTGNLHGGGRYIIKAVDSNGKYIRTKTFDIAGIPKLPPVDGKIDEFTNRYTAGPASTVAGTSTTTTNSTVSNPTTPTNSESPNSNSPDEEDEPPIRKKRRMVDEEDDEDLFEDDEDLNDLDFEPSPRLRPTPRFRPRDTGFSGVGVGGGFNGSLFGAPRNDSTKEEISKLKEELESKLDSKLERVTSMISNVASQLESNRRNPASSTSGLLTPELLQAAMPLAQVFLERNGSKDNILASQFDSMNQRIISLFEGMRDMTRSSEKVREELLDKMEQRALERQAKMEERFHTLLSTMKEGLENRHSEVDKAREEARIREDNLREERRRAEEEFRAKLHQEEMRWREELRQREEEARKAEMRWREEMRQKEVQAEREARKHELEILEKMRSMEIEKYKTEQNLLERSYQTDMGSKDQRVNLQMELAKIAGENELKLLQLNSQMQLERMKHESQLQIAKMRAQLETMSKKSPDEDPLDTVMTNFLKKKTQLMMIKELDAEGEYEDGTPSVKEALGSVIAQGTEALGPILRQILSGGLGQGAGNIPPVVGQGRVVQGVSPSPTVKPKPKPASNPSNSPPQPQPESAEARTEASPQQNSASENPVENNSNGVVSEPTMEESSGEDPVMEEISPEALQEQIMSFFAGENPQEVIGRVASFFEYVKTSIEQGSATPEEAAQVAKDNLLPNLVEALKTVESSREVIAETQIILVGLYGEEFASFFMKEDVIVWLDQMLESLRKL